MFQGHIHVEGERRKPALPGPTQESGIHTITATQRGTTPVAKVADNCTIGCRQDIRVVQQFCSSAKCQWQSTVVTSSG